MFGTPLVFYDTWHTAVFPFYTYETQIVWWTGLSLKCFSYSDRGNISGVAVRVPEGNGGLALELMELWLVL